MIVLPLRSAFLIYLLRAYTQYSGGSSELPLLSFHSSAAIFRSERDAGTLIMTGSHILANVVYRFLINLKFLKYQYNPKLFQRSLSK